MSEFEQVSIILEEITVDDTVPRNVRERVLDAVNVIVKGCDDPDFLRDAVNEILESVINDPNLPLHTRTQIWNTVSLLETI